MCVTMCCCCVCIQLKTINFISPFTRTCTKLNYIPNTMWRTQVRFEIIATIMTKKKTQKNYNIVWALFYVSVWVCMYECLVAKTIKIEEKQWLRAKGKRNKKKKKKKKTIQLKCIIILLCNLSLSLSQCSLPIPS